MRLKLIEQVNADDQTLFSVFNKIKDNIGIGYDAFSNTTINGESVKNYINSAIEKTGGLNYGKLIQYIKSKTGDDKNNKIISMTPDQRRLYAYNFVKKVEGSMNVKFSEWESNYFNNMSSARNTYKNLVKDYKIFGSSSDEWTFVAFYKAFCSDLDWYDPDAETEQSPREELYDELKDVEEKNKHWYSFFGGMGTFEDWESENFKDVDSVKKLYDSVIENNVTINGVNNMGFKTFLKTYAPELSPHHEDVIPGKDVINPFAPPKSDVKPPVPQPDVKPSVPQPDIKPPAPAGKSSGYTQLNPEDILKGYPVSYGMKGDIVTLIQELLQNASTKSGNKTIGYISKTGHPDKIFGPLTLNAVKAFQTANNLNRTDGVVDGETWNKLSQAGQVNESKKMVIPKIIRKKNTLDESLKIIKENMKKLR